MYTQDLHPRVSPAAARRASEHQTKTCIYVKQDLFLRQKRPHLRNCTSKETRIRTYMRHSHKRHSHKRHSHKRHSHKRVLPWQLGDTASDKGTHAPGGGHSKSKDAQFWEAPGGHPGAAGLPRTKAGREWLPSDSRPPSALNHTSLSRSGTANRLTYLGGVVGGGRAPSAARLRPGSGRSVLFTDAAAAYAASDYESRFVWDVCEDVCVRCVFLCACVCVCACACGMYVRDTCV